MAAALAGADWDVVISDNRLPRFSADGRAARRSALGQATCPSSSSRERSARSRRAGDAGGRRRLRHEEQSDAADAGGGAQHPGGGVAPQAPQGEAGLQRKAKSACGGGRRIFPASCSSSATTSARGRFASGFFSAGAERLMGVSAEAVQRHAGTCFSASSAPPTEPASSRRCTAARESLEGVRWEGRLKSAPGSEPPWVELKATPRVSRREKHGHLGRAHHRCDGPQARRTDAARVAGNAARADARTSIP